jgi:hypothetical protein
MRLELNARPGRDAIPLRNINPDLQNGIDTTGNRSDQLHIPLLIRDRGPAHIQELILDIVYVDLYIAEGWLARAGLTVPVRVDPGAGRSLPGAIANPTHPQKVMECEEKYGSNGEYGN